MAPNKPATLALSILLIISLITELAAQAPPSNPIINKKQEHQFHSNSTKTDYQVFVSLPAHYSDKDTIRYPVLFLLDGNIEFPIAHAIRTMLDFAGSLEDVIIVGIDYTWDESYVPWYTGRWRDLTPSADPKMDTAQMFLGSFNLKSGDLKSGGARQFMGVLKNEIIPFIQKIYKTNGDKGLSGHSFGGLFTTYCMLQEPGMFSRYGLNSPSYWWNKDMMFAAEKDFASKHKQLNAKIFMSVGSDEGPLMVPKMTAFADSLKAHNYPGMTLTTQVFDKEDHISVVPAMISRTLKVLYPAKQK